MKLLIIEDEYDLNNALSKHLKKNGYGVDSCYNGMEALEYMQVTGYDAIILDIMMPIMDGYEFLNRIRTNNDQTPVLLLTARDSLQDKVLGLDSGADDYLVKPFEFEELLARIRVMTRRVYGHVRNEIRVDDLILDLAKKKVIRAGREINLTSKEYEILEYLMKNTDHILTRQQIQDHVWDFDYEGASNLIDVLIKNIRKKIDLENTKPLIYTKRGLGYVIRNSEEDQSNESDKKD
jgi:DNA-binding response OmpR family regulator